MKKIILIILLFLIAEVKSQNLIRNGDFEEYIFCPRGYTRTAIKQLIPYWLLPTTGTSDYFNECGVKESKIPSKYFGACIPASGKGYAGFYCGSIPNTKGHTKNYREYLSNELSMPMIKDSIYIISFYYCVAPNSSCTINQLGIYFSSEKVYEKSDDNLSFLPQVKNDVPLIKNGWGLFYQEYKATGNEKYIIIGNFNDDDNTIREIMPIKSRTTLLAGSYYYIDNVGLLLKSESSFRELVEIAHLPETKDSVTKTMRVLLNNINFETGSSKLQPESFKQLDTLVFFLTNTRFTSVEISGHTDNIGNQLENYKLSEARAKAVLDYLVLKGVKKESLIFKGFADTFPLKSNDTEEGRKRNRRVEVLIK